MTEYSVFSWRDYTNQFLYDVGDQLNGETIRSACFSQRLPDTYVFPDDMTGVTFINCNLENCFIPPGNIVIDCLTRRVMTLEDGNDWIVDEENQPISMIGLVPE